MASFAAVAPAIASTHGSRVLCSAHRSAGREHHGPQWRTELHGQRLSLTQCGGPQGHQGRQHPGQQQLRRELTPEGRRARRRQQGNRSTSARALLRGLGSSSAMEPNADPVRDWICSPEGGGASRVTKVSPVFGGCINSAYRYDTSDGGSFFVKTNRGAGPAMFQAEAQGLRRMFETGTIRVPQPFAAGPLPSRGSYIIMEFVEFGGLKGGQAELGRQLGLMHREGVSPNGKFGFEVDNTIGSTPQTNPWTEDWATFFRDHRLGFQLELIRKEYRDNELYEKGHRLMDRIPEVFAGVEVKPCLLHGDLWSGNIAADSAGAPVILDPATYYGHSEAEFGMSWCASFGQDFYKAYFEVMPKQPGFEERVALYKLYHYLNHYNLFGSSYRSSCMPIIERFT